MFLLFRLKSTCCSSAHWVLATLGPTYLHLPILHVDAWSRSTGPPRPIHSYVGGKFYSAIWVVAGGSVCRLRRTSLQIGFARHIGFRLTSQSADGDAHSAD